MGLVTAHKIQTLSMRIHTTDDLVSLRLPRENNVCSPNVFNVGHLKLGAPLAIGRVCISVPGQLADRSSM